MNAHQRKIMKEREWGVIYQSTSLCQRTSICIQMQIDIYMNLELYIYHIYHLYIHISTTISISISISISIYIFNLALSTARRTQSRIGSSLVWQARKMSPFSTCCASHTFPVAYTATHTHAQKKSNK